MNKNPGNNVGIFIIDEKHFFSFGFFAFAALLFSNPNK